MKSEGVGTQNVPMVRLPDIIGYTLGEAREIINRSGIGIDTIKVTAPPREQSLKFDDSYRVVRLKQINNDSIELIVCKPL